VAEMTDLYNTRYEYHATRGPSTFVLLRF